MRIHLLVNIHRPDAIAAAKVAVDWMRSHLVEVFADRESAEAVGLAPVPNEAFAEADLVVSFGGDGTLIRAAHLCSDRGTPILGVYYGRFGFVTQCDGPELGACLSAFVDGQHVIEPRMMIQADLSRQGKTVTTVHALNEVILQRSVTVRMLTFEVAVDGLDLTTYPADGVMVSTPTGSTGYNLSAGGPILDPKLQCLGLTALAPHTLSARPLVLSAESVIRFRITVEGDAVLSADGVTRLHLLSGDEVVVKRSPRLTNLVSLDKHDFLVKLNERLFYGQNLLGRRP